jgi:hypothetical protein
MGLTAFNNNTNGILQPSPAGIAPLPGLLTAQFQRTDIAFDYAIAGIPFIGGESLRGSYFRRIYQRSFSPIRKDQFDNQQVPGEQSIWGWWLRSQSNFSQGAGTQFLDTTQDQTLSQHFFYSEGLDMLGTLGQATLLPVCADVAVSTVGPTKLRSVTRTSGGDGVLALDIGAKTLNFVNLAGTVSSIAMPAGLTGMANTFTDDGTNYYFADKTGIYKGAINSAAAATLLWNPPASGSNTVVIGWVKGRLVAGWDNSVYELVGAGGALPTAKFAHQNAAYLFTDVSETGSAILTSGVVSLQMPYGEKILSMYAYIGYFVGLGTNRGFRMAVADINGNLTYGPLVFQDPSGVGVRAIGGYDRFMFAGNQGNTMIPQQGWVNPPEASTTDMLIRVDLSQLTSTNSQPFSNDLVSPNAATGTFVNSVVPIGQTGLLAWATGTHTYIDISGTTPTYQNMVRLSSGFVYTPKIRYNTLEPKHFKFVYMRHQNITDGSIDILGQNPSMVLTSIAANVTGSSASGATAPFYISDIGNAQEWFQFKFVLHRGTTSNIVSPIFNGYQLRALPGVSRQILIELPLLCLDHETDRNGVLHGTDGYAWQRIQALEALIASGNVVLFQDLNYGVNNFVVVEDYHFEQQSPELAKTSSAGNQDSNAHGGYIILNCRVIS